MERSSIAFALILLATTSFAQQGWFWQNPLPQGNSLRAVDFTDATTGWAVGRCGMILHTTDGGSTWTPQTSGTSDWLRGVHFTDASTGWAVGDVGTILHTTDGGSTWIPQTSGTSDWLSDAHFADAHAGWAVGGSGTILHTTDEGNTWIPQTSGTSYPFHGVHFTDASTGWAVGSYGTILHTTTGGSTSIEEDKRLAGSSLNLSFVHTYPNPFTRRTTVQYTLPERHRVTIKVHNALGQEIQLLVDELQDAGLHTVIWDGRDHSGRKVPSGTYFLRLEAGGHSATRKLCVVR